MAKIKESILYVDDNKTNLVLFREVFKQQFDIDTALTPLEGLEKIKQKTYRVILVDYVMPEMSGLEFIQKARETNPNSIYMVITAYPDLEIAIAALNQGSVFRFLYKPWNTNEMAAALEVAYRSYYERENNRILIEELLQKNEVLVSEKIKLERENKSLQKKLDRNAETKN